MILRYILCRSELSNYLLPLVRRYIDGRGVVPEGLKVKKSRVKIIKRIYFNIKKYFVVVVSVLIILSWSFY